MSHLMKEGLLSVRWIPRFESLRFRRVNVQRPRAPHYERAKYLALVKPMYKEDESIYLPPNVKCTKIKELQKNVVKIENPLEKILAKELFDKFEESKMIGIVHVNPISGDDRFQARILLKREGMVTRNYSKSIVDIALRGTRYEAVISLFITYTDLIFSNEPKVDKLMKIMRKIPQYVLMAGIVDDRLLSVSEMKKYSEVKDITTARVQLLGVLNSCAQQTVGQLMAHPQRLVSQLELYASKDPSKS